MVKSKNKKRDGAVSMDVSEPKPVSEAAPEAMDTTETGDSKLAPRTRNLTSSIRGKPMKRTKKARKVEAALAKVKDLEEKSSEIWTSKKRGIPMKKTKNARKMKALAKAVALNEKSSEKASKSETKTLRTLSAKKLYD